MRLPGGRGRLALRSGSPEPPARAPRGEARRGEAGSASGGGPCHVWPAAAAGGGERRRRRGQRLDTVTEHLDFGVTCQRVSEPLPRGSERVD
ncbi:uncharacterized protein LOC124225162 isoform X9 [Equus quagga]|uniref:uncharacterized protein LOC124225162 isoform X9 n=1 Tax=Equus quagga TaxID=89248 RepID=UPI001EE30EA9|nr:uncharacterized protein LOC124225162 isoform X9 [Equus quagga]